MVSYQEDMEEEMSINTHIRYTLTCDKCGFLYFNGEKYADSKALIFHARIDKWNISLSSNGRSYDCICPDCKGKEGVE